MQPGSSEKMEESEMKNKEKNFWKRILRRKNAPIQVVYGSTRPLADVIEPILATDNPCILREAYTTLGVMDTLNQAQLVILGELHPVKDCHPDLVKGTAQNMGLLLAAEAEFARQPGEWLSQAQLVRGRKLSHLPRRVVLICNLCGGVGKTTTALGITRCFRAQTDLPTALVEVGMGGSSLIARLGQAKPATLYDVVTQDASPSIWDGVAVYPLGRREADVLHNDPRLPQVFDQIIQRHTLTVIDAFPGNPLWQAALRRATDILVVSAPREDSLAQTVVMRQELAEVLPSLTQSPQVYLVLTMVRSVADRLPLGGQISAWLPHNERWAIGLDPRLADPVIDLVYPGWIKRKKRREKKEIGRGRARTSADRAN